MYRSTSAPFVTGAVRRRIIERADTVLSIIPDQFDVSRPIGIEGGYYAPLVADAPPATFVPAVMFLTFSTAEKAAFQNTANRFEARGVIEITYRDGPNYGQGSYTIFLRVERLS
jgi:hypothetical protein